ncbi:MAG: 16S rRNA processing protein RimM [Papillibacter sp.]|jgi:16S rRNA processing protein RimM|nr:16S rRNA processing protein RimM [Papillibacter sp.]
MAKKPLLETGRIVNTHGINGEVKVQPWSDSPDFLLDFDKFYIDGQYMKVLSSRLHKDMVLILFEGVNNINDAMRLKNKVIFIDRNDVKLEEGSWFIQDAIGLPVYNTDGAEIGKLKDVLELPGGNVFVVQGETEHLIPSKGGFIKEVDIDGERIVVELIEGM